MSVLASKRTESKFEVIVQANVIQNLITDLVSRRLGIKDPRSLVRKHYGTSEIPEEIYAKYMVALQTSREQLETLACLLTNNIVSANSIYPTSMHEYELRRDKQNEALINCYQIIKELQHVIDIFNVDVNKYAEISKAINREIGLIKKWRQTDNKIKSHLLQ